MQATERIPLWESVTHPLANALEHAFGCHHGKLSRVFTLEGKTYKVCCDCGARFRYSLETMSIVHQHHRLFPSLRRLKARRRRKTFLRQQEMRFL
jgi:hypothetical protein